MTQAQHVHPQKSRLGDWAKTVRKAVRQAPLTAQLGMIMISLYAICAICAPLIAPYGEAEIVGRAYEPLGGDYLLGTDQLGRDMFSRLVYGARNTISIALVTTILSFFVGSTLGILAALRRGWIDAILSRLIDALLAIPVLIFALMLLAVFGKTVINLIVILALLDATRVFRLARSTAFIVVVSEYVEAAKLRGEGSGWIIFREVIPNIMPSLITEFGMRFSFVFLTISALSFLGVGIQPPTADWGSMVSESKMLITYGNPAPLLPAAAIAILAISVNFVMDWALQKTSGLRDEH